MVPMMFSSAEIEVLEDVSPTTAQRRLAKIRAKFGIDKYEKVSIIYYAKFRHTNVKTVVYMLKLKRKGLKKH